MRRPLNRRRRPASPARSTAPRVALFALAASLAAAVPVAAATEKPSAELPVLFMADQVTYDQERRIIRAVGQVEVSQQNRVLHADEMTFDESRNRLTASGNVTLKEPGGEVVHARTMELTGDFKTGAVEDLRAVLADGARVAAADGTLRDGTVSEMHKGVYSPCALCPAEPMRPPLWQVKAVKVRHDRKDRIVEFSHSWMEIDGVPVFYLPYFYLPDPTVKRKTGLLVPTFGTSSDFGTFAQLPVFVTLGPHADTTITPWFTTKEGPLLEAQYRQAFRHGFSKTDGAVTRDSQQRTRAYIEGETRYNIDDIWRAGLDVERASDRTFMRRYNFGDQQTLTSRLYAEAFNRNNYFVGNAYAFQGLNDDDDNDRIPIVAPLLDYYYVSQPDRIGGRTNLHLDFGAFSREDGNDTQRASARGEWHLPMLGSIGEIYTLSASLWGDLYNVRNLEVNDQDDEYSGTRGRLFPQASLQARMPFIRDGEHVQQMVEPIAEVVLAPTFGDSDRIPNEDSQDFEFEEGNLFGLNRFPGLDRVEEGPRVNYGVEWSMFQNTGARVSVFTGQSYRFVEDDIFPKNSGLDNNVSDVVNAVDIAPGDYISLIYRNRVNVEDGKVARHELGATGGVEAIRANLSYVRYDGQEREGLDGREEVDFSLTSQLTRMWRSRIYGITDLKNGGAQRELGIRFTYEDECFLFSIGYERQDIEDRDIEPSDAVYFRIGFKTLGAAGTSLQTGGGGSRRDGAGQGGG